ncbi:FecR family protein [Flavobacterium gelidilacus]|uniref:FecR family protein n=1 Tax=Flavobacterium gelidilacus TaxID=206041 RepID=UPI000409E26C|nr:FecR family protein [Flavobacterium gelidilacus]
MEKNYKLSKWLNGEMTKTELNEFQSQEDFAIYEKIKKYSSELEIETDKNNEEEMLDKVISSKIKLNKTKPLYKNWYLKIAAVLVIGFGLFLGLEAFSEITEIAINGKQNVFSLPDNSEVVMNSGSKIEYSKWNWYNKRQLNLSGEAYFKVAKGKKFTVNTNSGKVTVLGTQFNVKSRNKRFDVTCYEGKVRVKSTKNEVILLKGQTVSFENNKMIINQSVTENKPLWTLNEMKFEKEKFKNLIQEIEIQYNISLKTYDFKSEQLFTGTIPTDNIDITLQIIASNYHLKIKKINENSFELVTSR